MKAKIKKATIRFFKNGELEDQKIAAALRKAADGYENGELIETRDLLVEIVKAINEFEEEYEKREKA